MPGSLPTVADGVLQRNGQASDTHLTVGSPAWFAWLAAPTTRSFAFRGVAGTFTARKEARQRGSAYWSAYRSVAGRVRKTYLGTATALTLERLETAAASLNPTSAVPQILSAQATPPDPLLQTKLFIPRPRPQLVARERLMQQLTAALRHKVVVITGPAGAGKTTLLTAWHADTTVATIPLAWFALDESDNDPVRFWRYLCAALEGIAPGISVTILELLSAPQRLGSEALVIALSNLLIALPREFILALDDYHLITEQEIHQALGLLIERGPPQLHIVIISRAEPALPLSRLRARGDLAEVRASDLRFTTAEVETLVNDQLQLDLPADLVTTLAERTEGWAVGLHLAALALRNQPPAARADFVVTFGGSHRYIGDYLLEEVLNDQSPAIQDFLIQTAILGRLCGPLCDAMVQPTTALPGFSASILEQLERAGLFLVPLDEERTWYRYHRLFAELLRKRLHQQHPERVSELYRRASDWFAAAGFFDEAIEYAFAAHDLTAAASLIEQAAHATSIRNEHQTVLRWLTQLPPELVQARPALGLARAWSLALRWPSEETRDYLTRLEADPRYAPFAGELATYWTVLLILRDIPRCIAYGERALALLPTDQIFLRSSASVSLGIAYRLAGDLANAERAFKLTIALNAPIVDHLTAFGTAPLPPTQIGAVVPILSAQQTMGDVRKIQGRLHEAETYFERALKLVSTGEGPLLPVFGAGHAAAYLASLRYEWNQLDEAAQLVELALDPLQQAVTGDQIWTIFRVEATVAQARGDRAGALEALGRASALTERIAQPFALLLTSLSRLRHHLIAHDLPQLASEHAVLLGLLATFGFSAGEADPPPRFPDYIWELQELALAWVALVQEEHDEALRRATYIAAYSEGVGHLGCLIPALALQALAQAQGGAEPAALSTLVRALILAEPEGYLRTFIEFGTPLRALLRKLSSQARQPGALVLEQSIIEYAQRLQGAFAGTHGTLTPRREVSDLPEPLSGREREILTMLADGLANRDIAAHLFIASGTVKWHVNRIFGKLAVTSRTAAVARARTLGLLT